MEEGVGAQQWSEGVREEQAERESVESVIKPQGTSVMVSLTVDPSVEEIPA